MATVFIPTLLQAAVGGVCRVEVPGSTVRQIIEGLDRLHPGMQAHLVEAGRLRTNVSVAIDGEVSPLGLLEPVGPESEVHFVTAISGGRTAVTIAALLMACTLAVAQSRPVIVDDSAFYEHMPKGTILASNRGGDWLYNNTALTMRSQAYLHARTTIPEAGTYHLFVRSQGTDRSSFRVTVGDRQSRESFGRGPLQWAKGGSFELKKGPLGMVLSRVELGPAGGSTFDALVLSTDPNFTEAQLRRVEFPEDVELLKSYIIPRSSAVKFGDVDGDGKSDFFAITGNYDGAVYDHAGRQLWSYTNEQTDSRKRAEFEAPGLVWDFDGDGKAEVAHYRFTEGKEWLVVSDGLTGAIRHQVAWPTRAMPHEYNNFRLAVARLAPGAPRHLLAFTDSGGEISITAYTAGLERVWQHVEMKKKDHLGHYVYAVDLTGDGIDEVVASGLVLNAAGKPVWNRFDLLDDNHDHCDSFRFFDLDGDKIPELLAPVSEIGVMVFGARDGALLWRHPAEHTQQLEVGHFLRGIAGPQIAANARTYGRNGEQGLGGQVHWFDAKGNLLSKWPANPLNGNPDFVKGDWRGNGQEELFWYKFRLDGEGRGVLCFKQDVYHMFDFMGTGTDQVIARGGTELLIYGHRGAPKRAVKRDDAYRRKIANHSHY